MLLKLYNKKWKHFERKTKQKGKELSCSQRFQNFTPTHNWQHWSWNKQKCPPKNDTWSKGWDVRSGEKRKKKCLPINRKRSDGSNEGCHCSNLSSFHCSQWSVPHSFTVTDERLVVDNDLPLGLLSSSVQLIKRGYHYDFRCNSWKKALQWFYGFLTTLQKPVLTDRKTWVVQNTGKQTQFLTGQGRLCKKLHWGLVLNSCNSALNQLDTVPHLKGMRETWKEFCSLNALMPHCNR